jgi:sugar transferase (PEP-CTERM/EpsH1 system associated)
VRAGPLRLMHAVFSLNTGGLENGVVNLCNRLAVDQFSASICVFRAGGALEASVDRSRVALFAAKRHWRYDPTLPFRLAWLLRRRRIDILHTHSWGTLVEGVLAAKMAGTPLVVHGEHGILEERSRNVPVQRWLWSRADRVTAVAAPLADRMANLIGFPRDRIRVIANGVDTERFHSQKESCSENRRRFGLPLTGLLVGVVARLEPVKNHLGILHALARLRRGGAEAALVLAGDGPMRDQLQKAARDLEIQEHVYFLGNVVEVERLLGAIDVFVLNSQSEGMSNTILEAMASGVPVIATAVGSNPALVADGETGYLVPADDPAMLSRAMERLAGDQPLRREMGSRGRLRVERDFSIARMVDEYADLYRQKAFAVLHSTADHRSTERGDSEGCREAMVKD